jgi:hypothetical protein
MSNFIDEDWFKAANQSEAMARNVGSQRATAAGTRGKLDATAAARPPKGSGKGKKSPLDVYTQQLQKLLGGGFRKPYDDLASKLGTMGNTAQTQINTSMNDLETFLKGQANPFANFQATQTQANPELATLLQSQGVESTPLQQYATAVNAQQGASANSFQNMVGTLKGLYDAQQAGSVGDVALNRAQLQSGLAANQAGMGAAVNQQALTQQQNLMQMLLEALSKGGQTKGRLRL